ncbi:UvrD-helicase domain-containing protein [Streptomyces sp. NPDC048275]|uniref:UvrD-helicase domain-containing protein n=1 Tax=Streptomyces sp. NPDC048275 TaxID=3155629 RepID=UPI0033CC5647
MPTYPPTDEQQQCIDAFTSATDLRIQAGAGAGKTSTLKFLAAAKPAKQGVYVAYNASIKNEAKRDFPRNVRCVTSHGLAFPTFGVRFKHRLNGPRVPAYQVADTLGIHQRIRVGKLAVLTPAQIASHVLATVKKFTYSADREITAANVPRPPGYTIADYSELAPQIVPFAHRAWQDIADPAGRLKFEHDHYLKMWALHRPTIEGDYLMLDEAQDANPLVTSLVMTQQQMQRVAVGDSCQQLYAWRGADDALNKLPGVERTLSQSFRFGQAVADEANVWLDLLDADIRLIGFEKIDSRIGRLHAPDAILCRTNAGCMNSAIGLMNSGQRVALVGGGSSILAMAYAAMELRAGGTTNHPELVAFETWDQVCDYADTDDGGDLKPMVELIQAHGAEGVIRAVRSLSDAKAAQVTVSTAHKSKGLEWSTVKIGGDFYPPKKNPETGKRLISRAMAMLAYVAVTRARETLDCEALDWVGEVDGVMGAN